ncbi:MAG: hypothetical protein ACR2QH_06880 [Geminicoccaceae bacterium]
MNGKTKWSIIGACGIIVGVGGAVSVIERWWPWRWEHEALAESVKVQHMRLAEDVMSVEAQVVDLAIKRKLDQKISLDDRIYQCEQAAQNCQALKGDRVRLVEEIRRQELRLEKLLR